MRYTRTGTRTRTIGRWAVVAAVVGASAVGCAKTGGEEEAVAHAATVQQVHGSDLARVTLTAAATKRLGLELGTVEAAGSGRRIPYGAVFYDPEGSTWAFVNPAARTYVRAPIAIERIDGDFAYLADGPEVGTAVVTVGGPEIYGAELGVGDDE